MGYKKRMYFRRILRRRLDLFHVLLQISSFRESSYCRCCSCMAWPLKLASCQIAVALR